MDLYLIRHGYAEAFDHAGRSDEERELTGIGRELLKRAVPELRRRGITPTIILSSPFLRAIQTAEILHAGLAPDGELLVLEDLASGARPEALLEIAGHHQAGGRVMLVGHNPEIDVAVRLLAARCAASARPMRPSTLAWFREAHFPRYEGVRFEAQWDVEALAEAPGTET